ncbi:hypothetical protein SARC_00445 [Sphaeroforma arctica JP610]|uniref:Uncharacterized protein n=1 Tax=Sphaeroforma arctica JP610 TaxID=667725 RepID=A0A0L0GGK9_9EUKA|nr:hypothetical protein SARC_00445 [Sphaeroforma arctica JP610]KNC87463.1 hypothetical protein SARC_00445 [Sphaeroforma arctica JP610]|eukprot:XP_014161365.1 hypothetical protein SARC_00445 [Sphaeroforma arctica JP610]
MEDQLRASSGGRPDMGNSAQRSITGSFGDSGSSGVLQEEEGIPSVRRELPRMTDVLSAGGTGEAERLTLREYEADLWHWKSLWHKVRAAIESGTTFQGCSMATFGTTDSSLLRMSECRAS